MDDLKNLTIYDYKPQPQLVTKVTQIKKSKYPAFDAHNHLRKIVDKGPEFMKEYVNKMDDCNVQAIVDLDGGWGDTLDKHLAVLKNSFPGRFYIFAGVNLDQISDPDFSKKAVAELERAVEKGAQGLKIFKELGLGAKDKDGSYIRVDDPRLDPVWAKCGELNIPVLIHTSDPKAFFTPLDRYNERLEELIDNPGWMFVKPEYYTKDDLMNQRFNIIERHPNTKFIGAHVSNLPENLALVGQYLDKHPNYHVDLSARLSELGRQPYSARKFIIKYADRILLGTDGNAMGQPIEEMYRLHWRFFESDDEYFDISKSHKFQGRWRVCGIFLSDDVLKKVYQTNFLKLMNEYK